MTNPADTLSEDLTRIPGLFRRWELPEIFEPNRDYHIEDAGAHADGTPLVALYSSEAPEYPGVSAGKSNREDADPRDAIPANLLPEDIVAALPLALKTGTVDSDGSQPLPLFSTGGATVGDLREAIVDIGHTLKADGRKLQALLRLHQELVAHGADANAGVFEMLEIIATSDGDAAPHFGSVRRTASRTPIPYPRPRAAGTVRNRPE